MTLGPDPAASMMAGILAGVAKALVGHPLNTWKLHRQSGMAPPRALPELYRGVLAPMGRSAVEHGLHMTFRDLVSQELDGWGLGACAHNSFMVGMVAGVPQALVIAPMDYACTRIQLAKPVVWRDSFKGISWFIGKEMLAGMLFFGIYDGLRDVPELRDQAGLRGSIAAVAALTTSYPLDTLKTRMQAGVCTKVPLSLHAGLGFALAKCVVTNYVALWIYDSARTKLVSKENGPKN